MVRIVKNHAPFLRMQIVVRLSIRSSLSVFSVVVT